MNFYLDYVVTNKKLIIDKEKSDRLAFDKEIINVFEEQTNFPREMPKPINLADLTKYYNIFWKRSCSQNSHEKKNSNIN